MSPGARGAVVGVLGGMGPMATVETYRRIVLATPATHDQDHLHVVIDADPSVPDRTAALLRNGADPRPWLAAGATRLVTAGAQILCMPCNTAHAYYAWLQALVPVPIVNMVQETVEMAERQGARSAGILATEGTIASGVYSNALSSAGIKALSPSRSQQSVSEAIALLKAGGSESRASALLEEAAAELTDQGAEIVLLACTEISLVRDQIAESFSVIDALQAMVDKTVEMALPGTCPGSR